MGVRAVAARVRRAWRRADSVRLRTTLLATAVVAVVLVGAAYALVALQRRSLTDNIETTIRLRADDISGLLAAGTIPGSVTVADDEVALVQIIDSEGKVVGGSANVAGRPAVTAARPPVGGTVVERVGGLPIDDETFLVLARTLETPGGAYTLVVAASLEDVAESTAALVTLLWLGIPVLLLVVGGGTWVVVGRALSPVEAIRREVAAISGTEIARRVPEPSTEDEIGRLARTMNDMLDRLQAAQERQQRFVADASHELRSPLASMRTQMEVELSHPEAGRREATMAEMLEEVARMQRLVDDLLLLARADAGSLTEREADVDLDDIVLSEARRLRQSGGRDGDIEIDTRRVSAGQVRGDPDQLTRATRNLLDNAQRHARGRVSISLAEANGVVTLSVADDGDGIPAAAQARLFERFVRVDAGRARESGGAGLGLAIAQAIVLAHGGSIALEAGHGPETRFVVRLPGTGRAGFGR